MISPMSLGVAKMSSISHGTISARQDLLLVGPDDAIVPLTANFYYRSADPYAVTMSLNTGLDEPVDWTFARDLLAGAQHGPEGIGDVRAWPTGVSAGADTDASAADNTIYIMLGSPAGYAVFETAAAGIAAFLERTYRLVPAGQESAWLNLDAELTEILSQA
jgi:hypothetical protein